FVVNVVEEVVLVFAVKSTLIGIISQQQHPVKMMSVCIDYGRLGIQLILVSGTCIPKCHKTVTSDGPFGWQGGKVMVISLSQYLTLHPNRVVIGRRGLQTGKFNAVIGCELRRTFEI